MIYVATREELSINTLQQTKYRHLRSPLGRHHHAFGLHRYTPTPLLPAPRLGSYPFTVGGLRRGTTRLLVGVYQGSVTARGFSLLKVKIKGCRALSRYQQINC